MPYAGNPSISHIHYVRYPVVNSVAISESSLPVTDSISKKHIAVRTIQEQGVDVILNGNSTTPTFLEGYQILGQNISLNGQKVRKVVTTINMDRTGGSPTGHIHCKFYQSPFTGTTATELYDSPTVIDISTLSNGDNIVTFDCLSFAGGVSGHIGICLVFPDLVLNGGDCQIYADTFTWIKTIDGSAVLPTPVSLNGSQGIAVDSSGNIYVADTGNNQVVIFNAAGTSATIISTFNGGDTFSSPQGITLNGTDWYVTDFNNNRVVQFSRGTNAFVRTFGSGILSFPIGIGQDLSGNILVVDSGNHRIVKYSTSGGLISNYGSSNLVVPAFIVTDSSGNTYVTDIGSPSIVKFDNTGAFVANFSSSGTTMGFLSNPLGIAIDNDGNIIVADPGISKVYKFDTSGNFLSTLGSFGASFSPGKFNSPNGIAVDSSGYTYVMDGSFNTLSVYNFDLGNLGYSGNAIIKPTTNSSSSWSSMFSGQAIVEQITYIQEVSVTDTISRIAKYFRNIAPIQYDDNFSGFTVGVSNVTEVLIFSGLTPGWLITSVYLKGISGSGVPSIGVGIYDSSLNLLEKNTSTVSIPGNNAFTKIPLDSPVTVPSDGTIYVGVRIYGSIGSGLDGDFHFPAPANASDFPNPFTVTLVESSYHVLLDVTPELSHPITDTIFRKLSSFRTLSEAHTVLSDSISRIGKYSRTITESNIPSTDMISRLVNYFRSISESNTGITDAILAFRRQFRTITESGFSLSDTLDRVAYYFRTITELFYSTLFDVTPDGGTDLSGGRIWVHVYTPASGHKVRSITLEVRRLNSSQTGIVFAKIYDNPSGTQNPLVVLETSTNSIDFSTLTVGTTYDLTWYFDGTGAYNNQLIGIGIDGDSINQSLGAPELRITSQVSAPPPGGRFYTKPNHLWNDLVAGGNQNYVAKSLVEQYAPAIPITDSISRLVSYFRSISESDTGITDSISRTLLALRSVSESNISITDIVSAFRRQFRTIIEFFYVTRFSGLVSHDSQDFQFPTILRYTTTNNRKVTQVTFRLDRQFSGQTGILHARIYRNPTGSNLQVIETSANSFDVSTFPVGVPTDLTFVFEGTGSYSNEFIGVGIDPSEVSGPGFMTARYFDPQTGFDGARFDFTGTWNAIPSSEIPCKLLIEGDPNIIPITDSISRVVSYFRTISESNISITDTIDRIVSYFRSISESNISITDTISAIRIQLRSILEDNIPITDTIDRTAFYLRQLIESGISLTDTILAFRIQFRSVSELNIALTDMIDTLHIHVREIRDNFLVSDAVNASLFAIREIMDFVNPVVDSLDRVAIYSRNLVESSQTITDSIDRKLSSIRTIFESAIPITDIVSRITSTFRSISESNIAVTDTTTPQTVFKRSVSELNSAIADVISYSMLFVRRVFEFDFFIVDNISTIRRQFRTLSESNIPVTDSIFRQLRILRFISEANTAVTDSITTLKSYIRSILESNIHVSDTIMSRKFYMRMLHESGIAIVDKAYAIKLNIYKTIAYFTKRVTRAYFDEKEDQVF